MVSAELAARRTAAAAVAADFRNEADAFINDNTLTLTQPGWPAWAFRLASELEWVLRWLDDEKPDPAAAQLAAIRLVLEHFDWQPDDRQYALEQIDEIMRGDR